jgi:hypothetical protein
MALHHTALDQFSTSLAPLQWDSVTPLGRDQSRTHERTYGSRAEIYEIEFATISG